MKKRRLNDAILEEAARRVVEEDYQRQNEKALEFPHTFRPEYQIKMNRLFASADALAVHTESDTVHEDKSFLEQLNQRWTGRSSLWSYRRYIAVAALLMVGMSAAALASDDIRNGLRRLSLQFFSDNVTIEAAPESTTGQEGDDTANGEFYAYKWKEVPEENIEAEFIGKEMTEVVKNLIEQMEYPYKQVVLLQYYNKMKGRDIAETLHLKPENVRQIAKRAREQLKKQLKELGYM